jgi:hypothetical protein
MSAGLGKQSGHCSCEIDMPDVYLLSIGSSAAVRPSLNITRIEPVYRLLAIDR